MLICLIDLGLELLFALAGRVPGVRKLLGVLGTDLVTSDVALVLEELVDASYGAHGQAADDDDLEQQLVSG
jgi:hypothetical protein